MLINLFFKEEADPWRSILNSLGRQKNYPEMPNTLVFCFIFKNLSSPHFSKAKLSRINSGTVFVTYTVPFLILTEKYSSIESIVTSGKFPCITGRMAISKLSLVKVYEKSSLSNSLLVSLYTTEYCLL